MGLDSERLLGKGLSLDTHGEAACPHALLLGGGGKQENVWDRRLPPPPSDLLLI